MRLKPDFQIIAGDTLKVKLTVKDKNGTLVDLTGVTGTFTIRNVIHERRSVIISKDVTIEDAAGALISVIIDAGATEGCDGIYPFDFQIVFTDGSTYTPLKGYVKIVGDVTYN